MTPYTNKENGQYDKQLSIMTCC